MSRLKLSRETRALLFAGNMPQITGNGPCPVEPGTHYPLSNRLSIKVLAVTRHRKGGWVLRYELHDKRDTPKLIRRTPGIHSEDYKQIREGFDDNGYPAEPTEAVIKAAGRESSYTSVPGAALTDAGEAVDDRTQEKITKNAKRNASQQDVLNQLRRERYEIEQRLERARTDARIRGVDISSPIRVIERQLAKIERRIYEGKAA